MKHNVEVMRRILRLGYEALFSVLLMEFFMIIFVREKPSLYGIFIVLGLYLISYLAREQSSNILILLLSHMIPVGVLALTPVSRGFLVICILLSCYLFDTACLYVRGHAVLKPVTDFPWATFLISFIIYLYGYFTKSDRIVFSAYIIPVVLIFIYLTSIYLDGLKGYLEATKDVGGIPVRKIVLTNTAIVAVIMVILLAAMVLCRALDFSAVLGKLGQGVAAVLRIVWLVLSFFGSILSSMITTGRSNLSMYGNYYGQQLGAEAGKIGSVMELVLKLALLVLAGYLLYRLMRRLLRFVFANIRQKNDVVETVNKPVRKKIIYEMLDREHPHSLTAEEKIRRLYRNRMLKYRYDISLNEYRTSRELEQEIHEQNLDDVHELTDIYADVRYGGVKPDKRLLRKMKVFARR